MEPGKRQAQQHSLENPPELGSQSYEDEDGRHHPIPEFLYQLTKMLSDDNSSVIEWQEGKIKVHDPSRLEEILQKYFRHSKFASFQRQLNYFGFRKIAGKGKLSPCSYVNEMATEDIRSLLLIKRKTNGSAARKAAAAAAATATTSVQPTFQANNATPPFLTVPINAYAQLNFLALQHQQLQRQVLEAQQSQLLGDPKQMLQAQQKQLIEAHQRQMLEAQQKQMLETGNAQTADSQQRNLLEAHQKLLHGLQQQSQQSNPQLQAARQQLMQQAAAAQHQQLLEAAQKQLEEQQKKKLADSNTGIGPATAALGLLPTKKPQEDTANVMPPAANASNSTLPYTSSVLQFQPMISAASEDLLRQRLPSQASLFPDLSNARLNSLLSLNSFLGSSSRLNSEANMQSGNM